MHNKIDEFSECRLCQIVKKFEEEREIQDTLIDQTNHFQWLPGLGAFIEGYSLIVSKKHVFNTGCLSVDIIKELELFIIKIKKILKTIYKSSSIVFEHGSIGKDNYAGASIEHHHVHVFPVDIPLVPNILLNNFTRPEKIISINDLKKYNENQIPYIYYSPSSGEHYVFEVPNLEPQYLRRVIAKKCNSTIYWDWRKDPFIENIHSFVKKVRFLEKNNA